MGLIKLNLAPSFLIGALQFVEENTGQGTSTVEHRL
jgi:hypothetical protein